MPDEAEIRQRVLAIVARSFRVPAESIDPSFEYGPFGLSLEGLMELEARIYIEREFNIEIPDSEVEKILSIDQLVDAIKAHLALSNQAGAIGR